jgi:hypothetical protein
MWIVALSLLSILSVAGVVAEPVMHLGRSEAEREVARRDALQCSAERAMLQRFEDAHGWERTADALRALSARLPRDVSPIEIHGLLRLLAASHRIELASADISGEKATNFAVLDDCVTMREVDVRGVGTVADWVGLTEDLARAGYPTSVLELSLQRRGAQDGAFDTHLVLGLYSTRPSVPNRSGGA